MSEFKSGKTYRIAYKPYANLHDLDKELICPKCENNKWTYYSRTGVGKLSLPQMKWKCTECGMYYILNRENVTKILGV